MANLKYIHLEEDDPLNSYYITLCHVYYFNVSEDNSEKEQQQADATIETLSSLIFHAINIEGTTIREMDNEQYEKEYKRFYGDIMTAIKECCQNTVEYDDFLVIMDEIIGAAIALASAFNKIDHIRETTSTESTNQLDEVTTEGTDEGNNAEE
jgi:hypothetical protein